MPRAAAAAGGRRRRLRQRRRLDGDARLRARGPVPRLLPAERQRGRAGRGRPGRRPRAPAHGVVRQRRLLRVDVPALRLARDGTAGGQRAGRRACSSSRPAGGHGRSPASGARDLAMHGGTVYWTEAGQARSTGLPGARRGGDGARAGAPAPPRRGVRRRARAHDRRLGLGARVRDGRRALRLPDRRAPSVPARRLGAAADRRRPLAARLRRGHRPRARHAHGPRPSTRASPVSQATLLADGTLAWIESGGRLLARSPERGRRRALRRPRRACSPLRGAPSTGPRTGSRASTGRRARPGRPRSPGS